MSTTTAHKQERDQAIIDMYKSGETASKIARQEGVSEALVRKVLREAGITIKDRTAGTRGAEKQPLSAHHKSIGEKLASYRLLTMKLGRREAAAKMGWSLHKLAAIEQGTHELELLDLMDIVGFMKCALEEIISARR